MYGIYFVLLSFCFSFGAKIFAAYELKKLPTYLSCPFIHNDSYAADMSNLHLLIKEQIKTKIEGNNRCRSFYSNISQKFSSIETLYGNNKNPSLYEEIKEEVISKQIMQLKLNKMKLDSSESMFDTVEKKILDFED